MTEPPKTKSIDVSVEINADAAAVWHAISNAEELRRWFSLDAALTPGVGGEMTLSWGPDVKGTAGIAVWEENAHLQCVEEWPGDLEPVRVAVDYTIEAREGSTVLRVVNSGFQAGEDWSDYLDTLDSGWRYFLWNLKVYLERHAGTPRRMVWDRRKISAPKPEAWELLTGPGGLIPTATPTTEDAAISLWSGHAGTTHIINEPIHVTGRFPELNDTLLLVELEPGTGSYSLGVWLSLYGVDEATALELEASLSTKLDSLFS